MTGIKKKNTDNMKKSKSEEHKKHLGESIKNKYKDPEYRKKLLRVKKNDGKTTIKINRCYNSNIFTI